MELRHTFGFDATQDIQQHLLTQLDELEARLHEQANVAGTMDDLGDCLHECRRASAGDWSAQVQTALQHPIARLLHQDPLTKRGFERPRTYPGDGGLLDLVYYDQGLASPLMESALGEAIYRRNRDAPVARALRERRDHMAALIDRVALRAADASVLALAPGHLREGLKSSALMAGALGAFTAVDQDVQSLEVVARAFGPRVTCIHAPVRRLAADDLPSVSSAQYDLIYAAWLLDCLGDAAATRLLEVCSRLLKPDGELVVANVAPDIRDAGYIESYMGWRPMYRNRVAVLTLLEAMVPVESVSARCYSLACKELSYLSITPAYLASRRSPSCTGSA